MTGPWRRPPTIAGKGPLQSKKTKYDRPLGPVRKGCVAVSHLHPCSSRRRSSVLAALFLCIGCLHGQPGGALSPPTAIGGPGGCRFGTDYGSGMVALGLPPPMHAGLAAVHADIEARQPELISDFLADQPYAPHASLIYGVTPQIQARVASGLRELGKTLKAAPVTLGALRYWDDAAGGKTTLVVAVNDPAEVLLAAHSHLQEIIGAPQRFPYSPHITLAYLRPGARLSAAVVADIEARLRELAGTPRVMWLTDPCGLARGYEAFDRPASAGADHPGRPQ